MAAHGQAGAQQAAAPDRAAPVAAPRPLLSDEESAFQWGLHLDGESVSNLRGGLATGTAGDSVLQLAAATDTGPLGLWQGGRLALSALRLWSGEPSARYIGDLQGVSNLEAPPTTRLYEAWYRQDWAGSGLALRVGLMDMNDQLAVTDSASTLLNASFGVTPTLAANIPVSTYPDLGVGVIVSARREPWEGHLAIFQGDPGERSSVFDKGYMVLAEGAHGRDPGARVKLGLWRYRGRGGELPRHAWGAYALGETPLVQAPAVRGFLQVGTAPGSEGPVSLYLGAGLTAQGLFPTRPYDRISVGIAHARLRPDGGPAETAYELTYAIRLWRGVFLQPDLQWVAQPAGTADADDALVAMLRVHVEFF